MHCDFVNSILISERPTLLASWFWCNLRSQSPFALPHGYFHVVLNYLMDELSRSSYSLQGVVEGYSEELTGKRIEEGLQLIGSTLVI